jgi:trigger factor
MKATVEPLEGNKVKLSVEVDEQEFEKAVDAAFRKMARDVRVPGFRPGKVPRRLLEARIGRQGVRQEAMREALPEFYAQALREADVDPIAPPEIDVTGGQESGPLAFDAVVEVRPQVNVAGYQGLRVTVPGLRVSDEEVSAHIDRLRQPFGELREVARPARDGDHVTIDLTAYRHDETLRETEDELYEVGSGSIVPELDTHLRGAKPGDIFKFNARLGADRTGGDEEEVTFRVLVKQVKEMVLPDVTDEWASEASEFETVEELTADIRRRLGTVKRLQASLAARDEVIKALVELIDEEMPDALVAAELQRRSQDLARALEARGATLDQYREATGMTDEQLIADLQAASVHAVKADLALRAVADDEGLEAGDEEVDAEIARLAERIGDNPAALRRRLEHADQMPAVRSDVRKAKALGWLMEHVEMVDEEGSPIDPAELSAPPPTAHQHDHSAPAHGKENMETEA